MYDVWKNALAEIEQKISPANFSTWFQDTTLLSAKDGAIIVGVKNTFYVKQLRTRYHDIIRTALENNQVPVNSLDFEVNTNNKSKVRPKEITKSPTPSRKTSVSLPSSISQKPLVNGLNNKYTLDNFIVGSNNDVAVAAARSIIDAPDRKSVV